MGFTERYYLGGEACVGYFFDNIEQAVIIAKCMGSYAYKANCGEFYYVPREKPSTTADIFQAFKFFGFNDEIQCAVVWPEPQTAQLVYTNLVLYQNRKGRKYHLVDTLQMEHTGSRVAFYVCCETKKPYAMVWSEFLDEFKEVEL